MAKNAFTQSENIKEEYCASIIRVGEVVPVENSDFLVKTIIGGFPIVCNKDDIKSGDVVIYCKNETELNKEFLSVNNMFEMGSRELNSNYEEVQKLIDDGKNDEAKKHVGFFNKHCRVKMIRLRGCPSMGIIIGLKPLLNWKSELSANEDLESYLTKDENGNEIPFNFDTVCGEKFIKAYVPKVNVRRSGGGNKKSKHVKKLERFNRLIEGTFAFHYDTKQLNDNMWRIAPDSNVTISVKLHGCVERNTIVNTLEFGDITIGEIVDKKIDCHIKAFDTEKEENVYVPIDNFYLMKNDGEWYEIELEDGRKITITGNNPVWLPELKTYRRVDELNGDEHLLVD